MPRTVEARVPAEKGPPTVGELLLPFFMGRQIWDYRVESPISFNDPATIRVKVVYSGPKGTVERYEIHGTCVGKIG